MWGFFPENKTYFKENFSHDVFLFPISYFAHSFSNASTYIKRITFLQFAVQFARDEV